MDWIRRLFEEYKFARRATLLWAVALITFVVIKVVSPEMFPFIGTAQATVLVAVIGILATVVGFYQWHRSSDDFRDKKE